MVQASAFTVCQGVPLHCSDVPGTQAQYGWKSVEIKHFPLCRKFPLSGLFFPGAYLTNSLKEQKVDIHVIKILLPESD